MYVHVYIFLPTKTDIIFIKVRMDDNNKNNNDNNDTNTNTKLLEKLERIEKQLTDIRETLEEHTAILQKIGTQTKDLEGDCSKMRHHIDFIEDTYDVVRAPLSYVVNKIDYIMNRGGRQELPVLHTHSHMQAIENENEEYEEYEE